MLCSTRSTSFEPGTAVRLTYAPRPAETLWHRKVQKTVNMEQGRLESSGWPGRTVTVSHALYTRDVLRKR